MEKEGILIVFLTAVISGFSIFINKFGVAGINPYVFTFAKAVLVFMILFASIWILGEYKLLKKLRKNDWLKLAVIGLVGGSIPFLLFFKGLTMASAVSGAFIHKMMFVFVAVLAVLFLKERLSKGIIIAAALLLAGNFLLLKLTSFNFGLGEGLILMATLLWAVETIISKKVLRTMSPRIVAFGRMFFGAAFILVFLAFTGNVGQVMTLNVQELYWILITAVFLFGYVFTWYWGLSKIKATTATCILLIGSVITTILSFTTGAVVTSLQALGILFLVAGVILAIAWTSSSKNKSYTFSTAKP